jgi:hypothetical protein
VIRRTPLIAVAACLALALAGCTDHSSDERTIRALVTDFAAEHGPRACDLLTHNALVQIYGGKHPDKAHEQCVAASTRFRSAPIKITNIHWTNNTTAKVSATAPSGRPGYTVTAVKFGKNWRIDGISKQ